MLKHEEPTALNPEHCWSPSKKVFQENVQQYQNNPQAGFPLWRSNPFLSGDEKKKGIWAACEEEMRDKESWDTALKNEYVNSELV